MGLDVTCVAAYLNVGIGFVGPNIEKLRQLASWLRLRAKPWIVMADWNLTPEELADTRAFESLSCNILYLRTQKSPAQRVKGG